MSRSRTCNFQYMILNLTCQMSLSHLIDFWIYHFVYSKDKTLEYWIGKKALFKTLSVPYLLNKADTSPHQEARDALQLQLAAGGPGPARHRRGGDQHLGLLPRQDVPHQPRPLHLHVPVLLVSPQEHHHDMDHLPHHGTVNRALSRCLQTNLLPHFRNKNGFVRYKDFQIKSYCYLKHVKHAKCWFTQLAVTQPTAISFVFVEVRSAAYLLWGLRAGIYIEIC